MFSADVYKTRRQILQQRLKTGVVLFPGNIESSMNYPANTYPFRQDSTFLYYFGVDAPGFWGLIDLDEDRSFLAGDDFSVDDIIWMGPQPKVAEYQSVCSADGSFSLREMTRHVQTIISKGRKIHFVLPYRPENRLSLSRLLGIHADRLNEYVSIDLVRAIISQREKKNPEEIREIELALDISWFMIQELLRKTRPGATEQEIVASLSAVVESRQSRYSFPVIVSIHGETLHNHHHRNTLKEGDLLVCDSGAESPRHYASDITRTVPVGGRFQTQQKDVYLTVLSAQEEAIRTVKPGVAFREAHLTAARTIVNGLKALGLMKGDSEEAVAAGAHALFFPHGLGHMMGLDVHDMEDLGENHVGYNETIVRSEQFGLAYLRMAKPVQPGHVITVEPGIYFIPELIDLWYREKKHAGFINYEKVLQYKGFGGIRIEDDILVTDTGCRLLGRPIPKKPEDIEPLLSCS